MDKIISFKSKIDVENAVLFLENVLGGSVSHVSAINEGEVSRVFSFVFQDQAFVAHFSQLEDYEVRQFLYTSFSTYGVRMPWPIKTGKIGDLHYSIDGRVDGTSVDNFSSDVINKILPDIVEQLMKITDVSIENTIGYGPLRPSGEGTYESWSEFLEFWFQDNRLGFWDGWYKLFDQGLLEREVFDHYYTVMMNLAKRSAEERYLVHGDFHLGNLLSNGTAVTGIVDWGMVLYGDFMFDVATLHFWRPDLKFPQAVLEAWKQNGRIIPNFNERLTCGLIFKGLDGLRFNAKKNDRDGYNWIKHQLAEFTK